MTNIEKLRPIFLSHGTIRKLDTLLAKMVVKNTSKVVNINLASVSFGALDIVS